MNLLLSTRVSLKNQTVQKDKEWKAYAPLPYPDALLLENQSTYDILKASIRSYSTIKFDVARFYIELDVIDEIEKRQTSIDLRNFIEENVNSLEIIIEFNRPSNLADWKKLIADIPHNEKVNPSIVNMNHDHLHDPELTLMLETAVVEVFANDNNNRKILAYTHIPENINWLNIGNPKKFKKIYNKKFFSEVHITKWVDCLYIMNLNCLSYVFESISYAPDYLPRFDWPGVKFKKMHFIKYVYPCEFFYHRDGYGHVTGIRNASWQNNRLNFINSDERERIYLDAVFDKYQILFENNISSCTKMLWSRREIFFRLIGVVRSIEFDLNTRMYSTEIAERKDKLINEFTSYNCNELINIYNTSSQKFSIKSALYEIKNKLSKYCLKFNL